MVHYTTLIKLAHIAHLTSALNGYARLLIFVGQYRVLKKIYIFTRCISIPPWYPYDLVFPAYGKEKLFIVLLFSLTKMDDQQILALSVIKIEKEEYDPEARGFSVKEEKDAEEEEYDPEACGFSVKEEKDAEEAELEPPTAVFISQVEIKQEEPEQEYNDPLAFTCKEISNAAVNVEECADSYDESVAVESLSKEKVVSYGLTPPPSIPCFMCNKILSGGKSLLRHMQTHTGEKPHTCSICLKRFSEKKTVKLHMRSHTGDVPHECSICKEGFAELEHLVNHLESHVGKTHECFICKEDFETKYRLTQHLHVHKGVKYSCSVCGKNFVGKRNLDHHMPMHTREKLFECTVCRKNFKNRSSFKKHMQTH